MNTSELSKQIENLTRYIMANPSENLTIFSENVISKTGDAIARFNNHLQAVVAVRSIREFLADDR